MCCDREFKTELGKEGMMEPVELRKILNDNLVPPTRRVAPG